MVKATHFGGAIGSTSFINLFELIESKFKGWIDEIKILNNITRSQPHAVYMQHLHNHGLYSKWNYVLYIINV
jgi:cell fate (sporulation/competence/biofilm development) regulator YmcA (YheA/YmcA/DUF963 family)